MTEIRATRTIHASPEHVFETIARIENFSKAVPHIVEVEVLTDQEAGVGTRFRETRDMNGRRATTELEVKEYVPNERVRMVSDAGGTVWDTLFTVAPEGTGSSRLDVHMDCRPHKLLARIVTPLIRGMVSKAVEADLDSVKQYCEGEGACAS